MILHPHICKTAGMSMVAIYRAVYGDSDRYVWHSNAVDKHGWLVNEKNMRALPSTVRVLIGEFQFGVHRWLDSPCTYVTMLRDPVERVVSMYHYFRGLGGNGRQRFRDLGLTDDMTLHEFVTSDMFVYLDNSQTRQLVEGVPYRVEPIEERVDGEMLNRAMENIERFAVVGIVERFVDSLRRLADVLDWQREPTLVRLNARIYPGVDELPLSTVAAIRDRNEYDIALYDFALERYGM